MLTNTNRSNLPKQKIPNPQIIWGHNLGTRPELAKSANLGTRPEFPKLSNQALQNAFKRRE